MQDHFSQKMNAIHGKRRSFQPLTKEEFQFLLADCILDTQLFASPNWNWRYGGVRYAPDYMTNPDPSKILVLQWPGKLGDVCMSAPVFYVLRQKYPRAEISFLSSKTAQGIFWGNLDIDVLLDNPLDPYLERVTYPAPIKIEALLKDISSLIDSLTKTKYNLLINLQVLPMSAVLAKLSGAEHTIGMTMASDGMPVIRGNIWAAYLFGVSANLMRRYNLLHRTEIFTLMNDEQRDWLPDLKLCTTHEAIQKTQAFFDREGIRDDDVVVGINPMAGTPIRKWPYYDRLAKKLKDDANAKVIIFGAKTEELEVDETVRKAGTGVIKATHFNLQELMAAISGCDLFITNDTGPMHLACLLKRKVIALFGPTSIREVGPWQAEFHALQSSLCRECYKQECLYPEKYCMNLIPVEKVYEIARKVLKNEPINTENHPFGKNVNYWRSKDGPSVQASTAEETFYGRALLQVLNGGKGFPRGNLTTDIRNPRISDDLFKNYRKLQSLAKNALKCIKNPSNANLEKLRTIDQAIFRVNAIFKPLVVLNDLRFLDKRLYLNQDIVSRENFYRRLLNDLDLLMASLKSQPWQVEPARPMKRGNREQRG